MEPLDVSVALDAALAGIVKSMSPVIEVGLRLKVYLEPEPEKSLRVAGPEMEMSDASKLVTAIGFSLFVKLTSTGIGEELEVTGKLIIGVGKSRLSSKPFRST